MSRPFFSNQLPQKPTKLRKMVKDSQKYVEYLKEELGRVNRERQRLGYLLNVSLNFIHKNRERVENYEDFLKKMRE